MTKDEIVKNFAVISNMTKWQRIRFEMLVSASGALIRFVHLAVFVGIVIMVATRFQSQTWYNWKNDERLVKLEQRVNDLEIQNGGPCEYREADLASAPHKAMRRFWREDEHPAAEDSGAANLADVLGDELFDKINDWMWKHHPTEFFLGGLLLVGTLVILLFEGPAALWKLLFGKTEDKKQEDDEPSDYEPTTVPLLDSLKEVKKEAQTFNPPEIDEPKKD